MTNLLDKFKWNKEYILSHKLDEEVVQEAINNKLEDKSEEVKLAADEVFIEHPVDKDYYISQYGCAISLKGKKPRLLGAVPAGQPDRRYLYYKFMDDKGNAHSISANKAVTDVFCPNFWKDKPQRLEAHHVDGQKMHNTWTNLVLLPVQLHNAIHRIKKIVLLKDGIKEYKNPLDLVYDTGLSLEDILLADRKNKPLKSDSKYTVFNVKGHLIGYQYYPNKKKEK